MRQLTVLTAAVVALAALNATPARAQATTTFVSGDGLDTNPCTLAAPCRSFQRAHDQTTAGGQITMLDPAGYGAVTIAKAISIVNDGGGEAGITEPGSGSVAIIIDAGASDVVTLRGLTLNGVGGGFRGIQFNSGGTLNIQNCVIRGFAATGVFVELSASAAVTMADTIVSNNGGGVGIFPFSGTTSVSLERVTVVASVADGFTLFPNGSSTIQGSIVDSAAVANGLTSGGHGFFLASGDTAATIALINSQAIGNATGVGTGVGTVVLSRVTLAGNTTDGYFSTNLRTFSDDYIIDTTHSGTLTPIAEQ